MEAVARCLEATASRLEAIASCLEAIASRLEAIAGGLEAIATRLRSLSLECHVLDCPALSQENEALNLGLH